MKYVNLITSNKNKVEEYERYVKSFGIDLAIEIKNIEVLELQSMNSEEVIAGKVEYVQARTTQPFLIEDTSFLTDKYPDFPGTNTKFINKTLGIDGWRQLFDEGDRIRARTSLAFHYLGETHIFRGEIEGVITFKNLSDLNTEMLLNSLFYVESSNDLLGNLIKKDSFQNHRKKAFGKFIDYIKVSDQEEFEAVEGISKKWGDRASDWESELRNPNSYVNYEQGYDRFLVLIKKFMPEITGEVLDLGCGTGYIARQIAEKKDVNVTGIDISLEMIHTAMPYEKENLKFRQTRLNQVFKEDFFDVIVSRGAIISQIPQLSVFDFIKSIDCMAKEGAYFFFDFIQNLENGDYPTKNIINQFSLDQITRIMEEMGWVKIYAEESEVARVRIVGFHKSMEKGVYFVTSNPAKIEEFKEAIGESDITLFFCGLTIEEIKSDSLEKIVADKLVKSFEVIKKPVICTDGGIFINALNGFPGENSKQAAQKVGAHGLLKLMESVQDRSAVRRNCIGYYDGEKMEFFTSEILCDISKSVREKYSSYELDKILIPLSKRNPQLLTYSEIDLASRVALTELPQLAEFIQKILRG